MIVFIRVSFFFFFADGLELCEINWCLLEEWYIGYG